MIFIIHGQGKYLRTFWPVEEDFKVLVYILENYSDLSTYMMFVMYSCVYRSQSDSRQGIESYCCFISRIKKLPFSAEDGGNMFHRNVDIYLQAHAALQPRRQTSTRTSSLE
jgi:hypothetical protein